MKRLFMALAVCISSSAFGQNSFIVPGTVLESQQIGGGYTQHCTHQQSDDHSTAGTVIGGLAGGILGNQVGKGNGNTAATALGAVVGAMTGNHLGKGSPGGQTCQQVYVQPQGYATKVNVNGNIMSFMTTQQYGIGQRVNVRMDASLY